MTISSQTLRLMSAVKCMAIAADDDVMWSQGNGKCVISERLIGAEKHPHPAVRMLCLGIDPHCIKRP